MPMGRLSRIRPPLLFLVIIVSLLSMAVPSCSDEKSEPDGELSQSAANTTSSQSARIVVTKDFGATVLEDETLDPMGDITALEALKQVAKVETSYGGGFVNAIDGLCSEYTSGHKNKADWFWYINGMQSKTGAGEYKLRPGDVEHWDFRDWSFHYSVPAIVGHFPEPFLHGYGGKVSSTVVVYQDGFADEAKDLVIRLGELGIAEVISKEVAILTGYEKERSNLIIIGTESCNLISELNSGRLYNRAGFFAQLKDNKITAYDAKGDVSATYGAGCGLIQATQNPWNSKGIGACDNVVWTVAGTDATGVETAVDVLLETPEEFGFACGLIVSEEEVLRVPQ